MFLSVAVKPQVCAKLSARERRVQRAESRGQNCREYQERGVQGGQSKGQEELLEQLVPWQPREERSFQNEGVAGHSKHCEAKEFGFGNKKFFRGFIRAGSVEWQRTPGHGKWRGKEEDNSGYGE